MVHKRLIWMVVCAVLATPLLAKDAWHECIQEKEADPFVSCIEPLLEADGPPNLQTLEVLAKQEKHWDWFIETAQRVISKRSLQRFDAGGTHLWSMVLDRSEVAWERLSQFLTQENSQGLASYLDHRLQMSAAISVDVSTEPEPLFVEQWAKSLENISFPTLDGPDVRLDEVEAKAVLLDFWATWCGPCRQELPHLDQLVQRYSKEGLAAWAINAEESETLIRPFIEQLGLTIPVGKYSDSLREQLNVRALPTVVLLDHEGRVRERWNGYATGLEKRIAQAAASLLKAPDAAYKPQKFADYSASQLSIEPLWYKVFPSRVEALAREWESDRVLVAGTDELTLMHRDGTKLKVIPMRTRMTRPLMFDATQDGWPEVVAWNPGSDQFTIINFGEDAFKRWTAPSPVLDVTVVRSKNGKITHLRLATVDGVYKTTYTGETAEKLNDRIVLSFGDGANLEASFAIHNEYGVLTSVPSAGQFLMDQTGGMATLIEGEYKMLKLARGEDQDEVLAVLLPGRGLELRSWQSGARLAWFSWPKIKDILATDLNQDGSDELLIASENFVTAIKVSDLKN